MIAPIFKILWCPQFHEKSEGHPWNLLWNEFSNVNRCGSFFICEIITSNFVDSLTEIFWPAFRLLANNACLTYFIFIHVFILCKVNPKNVNLQNKTIIQAACKFKRNKNKMNKVTLTDLSCFRIKVFVSRFNQTDAMLNFNIKMIFFFQIVFVLFSFYLFWKFFYRWALFKVQWNMDTSEKVYYGHR